MKRYWNYSEHWNKDEYHFSVFYYEVEIEIHKKI